MIEKGDFDIVNNMVVFDINVLCSDLQLIVDVVQCGIMYYVVMSMKEVYFVNLKVCEVVCFLIDYQGINKVLMLGYGVLYQWFIKVGMLFMLFDFGYRLDVVWVKKLLVEVGYFNGFDIMLWVFFDQLFFNIVIVVQLMLMQVGINVKIIIGIGNQIYGVMCECKFDLLVGCGGSGMELYLYFSLCVLVYNLDNSDKVCLINFQGWCIGFYDL